MMAFNALVVVGALTSLAAAMVPPCLSQLGPDFCPSTAAAEAPTPKWPTPLLAFPDQMDQEKLLRDLVFPRINKTRMLENVDYFTNDNPRMQYHFHNRHCMSTSGKNAESMLTISSLSALLRGFEEINSTHSISIDFIENKTPQRSIILKVLPEKAYSRSQDIIVIGAHFDSINSSRHPNKTNVEDMVAPGADDNASGFAVVLETASVLAHLFARKRVLNEVQFHLWAAEEIGLVGSRSVFETMRNDSRSVKAVLNLDMVGYSAGHEVGSPAIAVHGDYTNANLSVFAMNSIERYSDATVGITACGYKCSDHASAWDYGFPSAGLGESMFLNESNHYPFIHTENDTIDNLDFDYMAEFVKVSAGFVAELAYTNFSALS